MKSNEQILDNYGKIIVEKILDRYYKGIRNELKNSVKGPNSEKINQVLKKLTTDDKTSLNEYIVENINSLIFDFLGVFEEHEEYKLIYEEDTLQVDLNKISEMLKAEPIIENGWIERFSKEKEG